MSYEVWEDRSATQMIILVHKNDIARTQCLLLLSIHSNFISFVDHMQ
jgi:hypothetical protein